MCQYRPPLPLASPPEGENGEKGDFREDFEHPGSPLWGDAREVKKEINETTRNHTI